MADQPKIALVSMPIVAPEFPSYQLALLKPTLEKLGYSVQNFSLYMYLGAHIGFPLASALSNVRSSLIGEWIFSKAAFADEADTREAEYFDYFQNDLGPFCRQVGCQTKDLSNLRNRVIPDLLDYYVEHIDWSRFSLIGFSVVFQQLLASLAMAKRLKTKYPNTPIIMGGAGFETSVANEVMRNCPEVDYIHCGDAELTLPQALQKIFDKKSLSGQQGIIWRDDGQVIDNGRAPNFADMDEIPTPDFDEYFYARRESGYLKLCPSDEVMLPIETARGCWWGAKHHCTYCGANPAGLHFRAQSVPKVLTTIEELSARYQQRHYDFIDNIIAPNYMKDLFSQLQQKKTNYRFHFEIRPTFSRRMLLQMKRGGLYSVQPGIESLSSHILKLMNKRSTGMRNVELIKWCTYYGINNLYFILVRFAGETHEDYSQQVEVIKKIHHLQAPKGITRARADPGSPMFTDPKQHKITSLVPAACYAYVFPKRFQLDQIAYYFDHSMTDVLPANGYDQIFAAVRSWQDNWYQPNPPVLSYVKLIGRLIIRDTRFGKMQKTVLTGPTAELYEFCAEAKSMSSILQRFDLPEDWINHALEDLEARHLLLHLDQKYLSLALPER